MAKHVSECDFAITNSMKAMSITTLMETWYVRTVCLNTSDTIT